jgi:arylsulfatase A-like enzyme
MLGRRHHYPLAGIAFMAVSLMLGPAPAFSATKKKRPAPPPPAAPAPTVVQPAPPKPRAVRNGGLNVLFLVADDLNDWIGWMGGHPQARTPNMDRLARMGMSFTNAHCAYALCNPSRTSIFTGIWPWKSGISRNDQDWRRSIQVQGKPTLPEYFYRSGFHTFGSGKIFHSNQGGLEEPAGGRRGFEQDAAWDERFPFVGLERPLGARQLELTLKIEVESKISGLADSHLEWGPLLNPAAEHMEDGAVADAAGAFLQKQGKSDPFFLAVGLYRPHTPWMAPASYFDERPIKDVKLPEVKADDLADVPNVAKDYAKSGSDHEIILAKKLWPEAVRAYLASVTYCDSMVGRVLDALERSPHKDNTIIVFTSDHGQYLGEKQRWHEGGLWEEATRVPLVIVAPRVTQAGTQTNQPVSLVDIYPTLCDLVALPKPQHLDGESLVPLLKDPASKRERPALTASGEGDEASLAVRTDRWRYIVHYDGSEELYDHASDPNEWTNLARRPEQEATVKQLFGYVPHQWMSPYRKMADVKVDAAADGSVTYWLQAGDNFKVAESPDIAKHGLDAEIIFDYRPEVDGDSMLLSQGGPQLGFALHMLEGKPAFTVNYDGLRATLKAKEKLPPGHIVLHALMGLDGSLALSATGLPAEVRGYAPMEGGFPRKPAQGLQVAQGFGVLPAKDFPNSTPFDGAIERVRFTLLPGIGIETRAARAVPAE